MYSIILCLEIALTGIQTKTLSLVVMVAFQISRLELPEEEFGEGKVFEVCVEVLSPGSLERPVDVYLSLEEGSAQGEEGKFHWATI